jgi:P27 family predicted phage terminase small subunit
MRQKRPTFLRLLDGSPSSKINRDEPIPTNGLGAPPADLSELERRIWIGVTSEMPEGMLKALDETMFRAMIGAAALHRRAAKAVAEGEISVKTTNGNVIQNPDIGTMNSSASLMAKLANDLGLTAPARARLKIDRRPAKPEAPENRFSRHRRRA